MVTQILNFGLPAPIDIQVIGNNVQGNREFIDRLLRDISYVPGTADLHIQQPFNTPHFLVDVDRSKAQDIGLTQRDVAGSLLVSTSGSFQTSPTYWLDPKNGVSYTIAAQSPQYTLQSSADLENIPLTTNSAATTTAPSPFVSVGASSLTPVTTGAAPSTASGVKPIQILGNVATLVRGAEPATVSHYNIAPVIDIYGNVVNSDLRSVSDKITADHCPASQRAASWFAGRDSRPGADDELLIYRVDQWSGIFHPAGLSAHRGEFPVVARSFYDHRRAARRVMRHRLDVVHHWNAHQRACA